MKGKYLLLGSNLGNKKINLSTARDHISKSVGTILRTSSLYQSEAWGITEQPSFLNQVLQIETILNPQQLLKEILNIELKMSRIRNGKWKERIIDIDILYYDEIVIEETSLTVPHPEIPNRKFTLIPLCEIAPEEIHPILNITNTEILENTADILKVEKIK